MHKYLQVRRREHKVFEMLNNTLPLTQIYLIDLEMKNIHHYKIQSLNIF